MICDRCGEAIPAGEEMQHFGQTLCEECYMQALSPARSCDPWAVRSAQALSQLVEDYSELSKTQTEILKLLEETGGAEAEMIAKRLGMKLPELRRELATLRHLEKVRGALREGRKVVCLW
jgi:DNA-binding transcriptional ArsR family regulator